MDISVVICTYTDKRWDTLVAGILSVQQQSLPAHEIIIVSDNNPKLTERLRREILGITVVENTGQNGISLARNVGIANATGEIVAFMDDDAIAEPDWLHELARCYKDEKVVGVGGFVGAEWAGGRPSWFPDEFNWVVGCSYRGLPVRRRPIRNFIGCNMSFRRDVFSVIAGFQDELGRVAAHPVGCEETELCIRIGKYFPHSTQLYEPRARVSQVVPASRKNLKYFIDRCFFEGRSKAHLTQFVGSKSGLSDERSYTFRTLPTGVLMGVVDSIRERSWSGIARSGAIVLGLGYTTAGYLIARTRPIQVKKSRSHIDTPLISPIPTIPTSV